MPFDQLKRRAFITLLGGAAAVWPLAARAQRSAGKLPRIGAMHNVPTENSEAFEQGLRDAGYVDGQNVLLETRFPGTALNRLDEVARELVALNCTVIFVSNPHGIPRCDKSDEHNPNCWCRFGIRSGG
jgi:putative tryptophan/tyrosine transport system substrate-binding protein